MRKVACFTVVRHSCYTTVQYILYSTTYSLAARVPVSRALSPFVCRSSGGTKRSRERYRVCSCSLYQTDGQSSSTYDFHKTSFLNQRIQVSIVIRRPEDSVAMTYDSLYAIHEWSINDTILLRVSFSSIYLLWIDCTTANRIPRDSIVL